MSDGKLQTERILTVHRLSPAHCLVVADGKVVYEGTEDSEVSAAFFHAGKRGATSIECFVNGVKVTFSKAV